MHSRLIAPSLVLIATILSVGFWFIVSMFVINAIDPPRLDRNEIAIPLITSVIYFAMEKTVISLFVGVALTAVFWGMVAFLARAGRPA